MGYITNPNQIIDLDTIKLGTDKIIDAAEGFKDAFEMVKNASDICDEKTLKVGQIDTQAMILDLAEQIKQFQGITQEYANAIRSAAQQVYNQQRASYQSYRNYLEQQKKNQS